MDLVEALRSIGEPTRLRALALLEHGELAVGEMVQIMGLSQPRLSRHMKFLTNAGLVERLPEGAWVFYRLPQSGEGRALVEAILPFVDRSNPDFERDLQQLKGVRANREAAAEDYFNRSADNWDDVRGHHYPTDVIEATVLAMAGPRKFDFLIDLGTGTGRMLSLFADRAQRAEGIDLSHKMLTVARSNLEREGLSHTSVRHGDVTAPPYADETADLVIVHQVLHYLDSPERVISEASRILRPGGRLIIVDFEPHNLEFLRSQHAHRHLGLSDSEIESWANTAGLKPLEPHTCPPAGDTELAVRIWTADKLPQIGERAA